MEAAAHPWPALGVLLLRDGLVTKEDLEAILDEQRDSRVQRIAGSRLGEILVERGKVTPEQVARLIAEQYELPFVELHEADIDLQVARRLPEELARQFSALPISALPGDSLLLAIADPATVVFADDLRRVLGTSLRFTVVPARAMEAAIDFAFPAAGQVTEAEAERPSERDSVVVELHFDDPGDDRYLGSPRTVSHRWPPLGALLIRDGIVTDTELDAALAQQRLSRGKRLGEILVERGTATEADIARLVAEQYELPFIDLAWQEVEADAAALLPEETSRRFSALPINLNADGSLRVAIADPATVLYSDELRQTLGVPLSFVVAAPDAINAAITFLNRGPAFRAPLPSDAVTEEAPDTELEAAAMHERVAEEVPDVASQPPLSGDAEDSRVPGELEGDANADSTPEQAEPIAAEPESHEEPQLWTAPVRDEDEALGDFSPARGEVTDTPQDAADASPESDLDGRPSDAAQAEDAINETSEGHVVDADLVTAATPEPEDDFERSNWPSSDLVEIVGRAVSLGATTVHLSPQSDQLLVRARIDGVMRDLEAIASPSHGWATAVFDAVPLLGQDETVEHVRLETLPTRHGERVTLHVQRRAVSPRALAELRMASDTEEIVRQAILRPSGAVLVCGPARSGRTTTLYAALQELNTSERTLLSVEDPIEHLVPGVDQVEVDDASGLTFEAGLRAALRSDPDVVLVGALDGERTARTAVEAAVAGRLILAALDARSVAAGVCMLTDLGLPSELVAAGLTCVVGQRLVRTICPECRTTYYATAADLAELERDAEEAGRRLLARGAGCDACGGTGFKGRAPIFEALFVSDEIRELVSRGASVAEIHSAAVAAGMRPLRDDGVRLCLEGLTTPTELLRVLGEVDPVPSQTPEDRGEDEASAPA